MVYSSEIKLNTTGDGDIHDITSKVEKAVRDSKIGNGTVTVFVSGSTAGITTIEYEPGLVADLHNLFEKIAPADASYAHNARWHDGNGYAHVRASLLGASLVVPLNGSKMMLGTWQQIVLVEFDHRPRSRTVVVQLMGE
jgi:secondary thiamine-phosphate synthase enzyme